MGFDPTQPPAGQASTSGVRDNFLALQAAISPVLFGAPMTSFGGSLAAAPTAAAARSLLGVENIGNFNTVTPSKLIGNPLTMTTSPREVGLAPRLLFSGTLIDIATQAIDFTRLQLLPPSTLFGRPQSTTGAPTAISIGAGLQFSGGVLSVAATAFISPTVQRLTITTPSQTYITPVGVKYIRVRMPGAGGGGGAGITNAGTDGTASTFVGSGANLSAGGGKGGAAGDGNGGDGGTATGGNIDNTGGSVGGPGELANGSGGNGGASFFGGAGNGGAAGSPGTNAKANSGSGGGGGASGGAATAGAGGGSGGYVEHVINSPGATYIYTVGLKGTGGAAGTQKGGDGADGKIIVDEFYI